jgi:hypothetical protein
VQLVKEQGVGKAGGFLPEAMHSLWSIGFTNTLGSHLISDVFPQRELLSISMIGRMKAASCDNVSKARDRCRGGPAIFNFPSQIRPSQIRGNFRRDLQTALHDGLVSLAPVSSFDSDWFSRLNTSRGRKNPGWGVVRVFERHKLGHYTLRRIYLQHLELRESQLHRHL